MTTKAVHLSLWVIFAMLAATISGFVWLLVYEAPPPVTYPHAGRVVPDRIYAGGSIKLERPLVIHKQSLLTLYRTVMTERNGTLYTYDLPIATSNKEPGSYFQRRHIQLPVDMVPGRYILSTTVCWRPSFIKQQCFESPELPFEVVE